MHDGVILVVEDEASQRNALSLFLKKKNYHVLQAENQSQAIHCFETETIDLILTDMRLPDGSGEEILKQVKATRPDVPLIVMTAYGNTAQAVSAMRNGAVDYITKPLDLHELDLVIRRELERSTLVSENRVLRDIVERQGRASGLISRSLLMQEILSTALRAAASDATILILGESGTGKEVLARAIHAASPRADQAFVPIHCAALGEGVIQSELFGHEKGAFTGAATRRLGRFEQAQGGTVFIDEVGDIPMSTQVQLLRVLQERVVERVGGNQPIPVDIRIVAATNKNLAEAIEKQEFREDLYYRLGVITIELPPLRKRKEDIPPLIEHFLKRYAPGREVQVSREALDALMKYDWPGNIRELENAIERAVVLARDQVLTTRDFPSHFVKVLPAASTPLTRSLPEMVEELEKTLIRQALLQANGNQSQAARILGITERNLRYKRQKYSEPEAVEDEPADSQES
ncbi:MAG: sigma-54 dependent transcriptional regulator [bacterium]|jgi:two-component system NtrC family response regulator|nr:sigma-54 dependent transcriptional regulator [bacterium]